MKALKWTVVSFFGLLAALVIFSFAGCGGGSGTASPAAGGASVSGLVADGAVANATVTAYNDIGLTNQIGSGSTDASGNFSFNLAVTPVPSILYLRATGGIDLSTGLPAPTMVFAGVTNGAGINITPLTDSVYQLSLSVGLNNAITTISGQLGVTNSEIYGGVSNPATAAAVNTVAASGSMAATLPDGKYYLTAIHFDGHEIANPNHSFSGIADILNNNTAVMALTVSGGVVTGTTPNGSGGTETVSGRVSGNAVVLIINSSTGENIHVAGTIGRLGGITGTFLDIDPNSTTPLRPGVFAASAVPQGVNATMFANAVGAAYAGPFNFIARGLFGGHNLIWGAEPKQPLPHTAGGSFTPAMFAVNSDDGSGINPGANTLTGAFGNMVSSNGLPTALAVMEYTTAGGDNVFIVQPVGSRSGIWLSADPTNSNEADEIGDFSGTLPGSVGSLAASSYNIYVASIDPGRLGQARDAVLNEMAMNNSVGVADFSGCTGTGYCTSATGFGVGGGNELGVFAGDVLGMKKDDDNIWDGAEPDEHIRLLHFFGSGAFAGAEERPVNASMVNGGAMSGIGDYPSTFVGIAVPPGSAAPRFSGTLNFLARSLYTMDGVYDSAWGSITISGGGGSIAFTSSSGSTGTAALTAINTNGIYHLSFASGNGTVDIFWPVGGRLALFFEADGSGTIGRIGEAYLTQ